MPVTTRSRSRRSKKQEEAGSEGSQQSEETKTPRRSARIAAKRARESVTPGASEEGKSVSAEPVKNPTSRPHFPGITLGSDTLDHPMKFIVPHHEPQSSIEIRQQIRQFTESPLTLKQNKNEKQRKNTKNNRRNKKRKNNSKNNNNNNNKSKSKNSDIDCSSDNKESETDYSDINDSDSDSNSNSDINNNNNNNNNRYQLTSEPSRVPRFNQNNQQWSFEPEQEMPNVARNLMIFIVGLILIVLAVVYKDQLFEIYQGNVPSSISDLGTQVTDFVSNLFSSGGNDDSTTETVNEAVNEAATETATETATDGVATETA